MRAIDAGNTRWLALAVIVAAQFMVVLDVAIVNVALPSIKTDLDFSQENLQWVITAYSIVFGGVLLLGGRLADLLGPPPALRHRPGALHGQLAARRPRLVGGLADRVPRAPGARRGAALAGGALDPDDDLRRGARAQRRARHLGRGLGQRRRSRRAARRRAHERLQLVVDLLRQRPRRPDRARRRPRRAAREPGRARPSALRRGRCGLDHRRPDAARLCDDPRDPARVGHARDDRAARRGRGADRRLRRDRAALEGAAAAARIFRLRTLAGVEHRRPAAVAARCSRSSSC